MIYQLPNGKILYITIEEYLSLSDDEFLSIVAYNLGNEISSHMHYEMSVSESIEENDIDNLVDDSEGFNKANLKLEDLEGDLF